MRATATLAREYNVSKATVGRVLLGLVKEGLVLPRGKAGYERAEPPGSEQPPAAGALVARLREHAGGKFVGQYIGDPAELAKTLGTTDVRGVERALKDLAGKGVVRPGARGGWEVAPRRDGPALRAIAAENAKGPYHRRVFSTGRNDAPSDPGRQPAPPAPEPPAPGGM